MKTLYFVDMDGVLADFIGGVEREFGREPGSLKASRTYDLHVPLNLSYGALSNRLRTATEANQFWLGLHPTPWAHELVKRFDFRSNAFILTSPWAGDYQCYAQKVEWCARYFDIGSDRVIPFPHKHLLAAPGRVLIDDLPGHCNDWCRAGGKAVLFPCQHNALWTPFYDHNPSLVLRSIDPFLP